MSSNKPTSPVDSATDLARSLADNGFVIIKTTLGLPEIESLMNKVFEEDKPGRRCLLHIVPVRNAAVSIKEQLISLGLLPLGSIAIQAIAFDKSPNANWKVPWHQDLMFPFAEKVTSAGYTLPTLKEDTHFAQPPDQVLRELLAVRIHLDDCGADNGPLRVSPGTHLKAVIPSEQTICQVKSHGEFECHLVAGDALLMRPLLLHASSQATTPSHRRVLHLVFHTGTPITERWAQIA